MVRDKYASHRKVKDNEVWLANREVLNLYATIANLSDVRVNKVYEFGIPPASVQVSQVRVVDGLEKRFFYVVSLASRLRFPLFEFLLGF